MPKKSTKSPAQLRAMKLGQQIRTIRGCIIQLRNTCRELGFEFSSDDRLIDIGKKLEARARKVYNQQSNKL